MNKQQLAERLARESHRSQGEAADAVDTFVYELLKDLRAANSKGTKKPVSTALKVPAKPPVFPQSAAAPTKMESRVPQKRKL